MSVMIQHGQFEPPFHFRNSPAAIARFPFPFKTDSYAYTVNLEPHVAGPAGSVFEHPFDVDEHYQAEMAERARVLAADRSRFQMEPHMRLAAWDVVELVTEAKASSHPALFSLEREGPARRWINRPLGIDQRFRPLDDDSLPLPPLEWIGRQTQGDLCLIDQRGDGLFFDAGLVTASSDWSLDFVLGMEFDAWHGPVPLAAASGVFARAKAYLARLGQGRPVRRLNWAFTVHPRLDASAETYHVWGADRAGVTPETIGTTVHLRVEYQALWRLPRSNAILFLIRNYLVSLADLATDPERARRTARVLDTLDPALVAYKGLTRIGPMIADYLGRSGAQRAAMSGR